MDMFREGGSTTRPPMLEGANYPYWKTKMKAYLKSVDERVWMAVSEGWTPPTEIVGNVDITKAASKWTTDEIEKANFNSKALNAIFNVVSTNHMKVVANCEIAKEAWDKLKTKNEGTSAVKKSRLRSLAREFKNLTMDEEDFIADFHAKLCDISNESYALGETYSNEKLVRKVLGSLPRRFKAKLTSIEEVHGVEDMDLDELIGSLQNYELTLKRWNKGKKVKDKETEKNGGSLAFVLKETRDQEGEMFDTLIEEKVALLTRNYAKFLRKNMRKNTFNKKENIFKKNFPTNKKTSEIQDKNNRGIQCRECDGFGHIQAECANTQKKKKALVTTCSDSEEDKDGSCSEISDHEKNVIAFVAKEEAVENEARDNESSCSESDSLDQQIAYEQMYPLLKGLAPASWKYKLVLSQLAGFRQILQSQSPSAVQGDGSLPQSDHSPSPSQGELSPHVSDKVPDTVQGEFCTANDGSLVLASAPSSSPPQKLMRGRLHRLTQVSGYFELVEELHSWKDVHPWLVVMFFRRSIGRKLDLQKFKCKDSNRSS
ncbi:uncharacterized protein LOC133814575 [Humulus lupulus]|uniref:uncharacterized protein LOC133814575 n=1 Tax=Humulus lupulus TaxID=3486 RepID=UPI002B40270D|nr:uncharacterized protein LOC133814575 [Humulus lupulus]